MLLGCVCRHEGSITAKLQEARSPRNLGDMMSNDQTMPCSSRHSSSLASDEVQGMVINAVSASAASCDDEEARSMGNSTNGATSLDPSGDMSYIQDPTVTSLSRGNSTATHSKNSSEVGEGQPWRVDISSAALVETAGCQRYTRTQPYASEPSLRAFPKASVINLHRPIMSRNDCGMFRLQATLTPRDSRAGGAGGCCGLCRAPSSLPCCAHVCVCCAYPKELEDARRDSSYLIIRDNSVEFNNPKVVMGSRPTRCMHPYHQAGVSTLKSEGKVRISGGTYTGACGCNFHVRDDARVLYFDDPDAAAAVEKITQARDEALVKMRLDDDARNAVHCE